MTDVVKTKLSVSQYSLSLYLTQLQQVTQVIRGLDSLDVVGNNKLLTFSGLVVFFT